jgi:hypothetical protein
MQPTNSGITAMKYHVEKCNLTVTVMDGKLEDIEKGRTDPHAIRVATFDATFDAIHALHGRLYLDWFAQTDLAAWLQCEIPTKHTKYTPGAYMLSFPAQWKFPI